ncbi:MAG TPA: c-type cytochrome domain-containing protein [Steroidobacteraceae bacterium]|nr:c-type cytochrome domain-containing protein [Steroidobacteraceae bacterium]
MNWIYFLGRFHVLAVHLPIGIIYVTVVLEFLARSRRFAGLRGSVGYLWAAAAISAIGTVVLGLMHSTEGGFAAATLARHRALGISVAILSTGLFFLHLRRPRIYQLTQPATGPLMLILVAVTGHYGGDMTHGSTYLLQYAPPALQRLAGMAPVHRSVNVADADVFADVVHPMLLQRCGACHGDSTQKGGLSFATYASTMKGGEDFPAVVPGSLVQSEMYYRITLPRSSTDSMPRDNKTPLTPDQVRIIGWWIQSGAPAKGAVGSLKPPADILQLIQKQLAGKA